MKASRIYEVDPLTCVKCGERMKILFSMEDSEITKKILKHLDLWPVESLSFDLEALDRKVE